MAKNPIVSGERLVQSIIFSGGFLVGFLSAVLANWFTSWLKVHNLWGLSQ